MSLKHKLYLKVPSIAPSFSNMWLFFKHLPIFSCKVQEFSIRLKWWITCVWRPVVWAVWSWLGWCPWPHVAASPRHTAECSYGCYTAPPLPRPAAQPGSSAVTHNLGYSCSIYRNNVSVFVKTQYRLVRLLCYNVNTYVHGNLCSWVQGQWQT